MIQNIIKERAMTYGPETLFKWEVVSLLTGIDTNKFEGIQDLNELRYRIDLLEVTELQKTKLKAIYDLAKRINTKAERIKIASPSDAAIVLMEDMRYLRKEVFKIILLDTKNNIIKMSDISMGSVNSSIVHPREVFNEAVIHSASSIVLVHNHPSGEPEPSHEDITLTNRLDECGKIIGIKVLDHIIIGDGVFYSFKEEGLL